MGEKEKQFKVEAGDEGESISIAPKAQPKRTDDGRIFCETCTLFVDTDSQWEAHILTKKHLQKASRDDEGLFDIEDRDLYVDESTNAYKVIMGSKSRLAGAEYIITEKDGNDEAKCLLCKALLKQADDILKHMRSQKHIHAFVARHFPDIFRSIQKKAKSKYETHSMILKYVDDLIRQYGKKEPLLHEKGYYTQLSPEKQVQVDKHLEAKRCEIEDQKKCQLSAGNDSKSKSSMLRKSRTPPARSKRSRTRSPSPSYRNRRYDIERDSRHSRRRTRSRSRSYSSRERYGRSRSRERYRGRSRSPYESSSRGRKTHYPSNRSSRSRHDEPEKVLNIEQMDELPTEPAVFETLCKSEITNLPPNERTYIQDLLDAIDGPIVGLDYMAEYTDSRGQYEPGYLCTLCEKRFNPPQAVQHAVGDEHTMAFMKKHYTKQYMALCIGTLGEEVRRQMKNKYLTEIGTQERRQITQKIILPRDTRQVFRHHKQVATHVTGVFESPSIIVQQSDVIRPPMVYSERIQRAQQLVEIERSLPPYCEKNLEEGWYSERKLSVDYYRRFAETGASYFSIRDPVFHQLDLYGDWNPQLMRRLQDKFNFKLDHIRWLQKLLTDWRLPIATPLLKTDLRPLEQEVESTVLNELLDHVLKPISILRNVQVFEYERYSDDELDEKSVPTAQLDRLSTAQQELVAEQIEPEVVVEPEIKKPRLTTSQLEQSDLFETEGDSEKSEKNKMILKLIDQILNRAKEKTSNNPVERLLVELNDARAILFRLATDRPKELQQLVTMSRDPKLKLQPEAIDKLRKKLKEVTDDPTDPEIARRLKEEELRKRIDEQRAQMLKKVKDNERQQKAIETVNQKPPSQGIQLLTPKLPGSAQETVVDLPPSSQIQNSMSSSVPIGSASFASSMTSPIIAQVANPMAEQPRPIIQQVMPRMSQMPPQSQMPMYGNYGPRMPPRGPFGPGPFGPPRMFPPGGPGPYGYGPPRGPGRGPMMRPW